MKNKSVISAVVGGAFFAVPYLALAIPFAPSIAIGAVAFVGTELLMSDPKKLELLKKASPSLYKRVEKANKDNQYILSMIPKIDDKEIRENLTGIHKTVNKIINVVVKDPKKGKKLNMFFDYYLPVISKILSKYDDIENNELTSKESKKFMTSSKKMIGEAKTSFDNLLSSLYQEDIIDADAEMKVFNQMLKSDGFSDSELKIERDGKNE